MNGGSPLIQRLLIAAVTLLIGALMVYKAVRLIQAVWVGLVIILVVLVGTAVVIAIIRARNRGW